MPACSCPPFRLLRWLLISALAWCAPPRAQTLNRSGEDSTIFVSHTVFMPGYAYPSGRQNWAVAVGDLDLDGKEDVVTASRSEARVQVHLSRGDGDFTAFASYPAHAQNRAACLLDANADGYPDLAAVTLSGQLCLLLNDRSGGLRLAQTLQTGLMTHDVCSGDFNGDGHADLAVVVVAENKLKLFAGDGRGVFRPGQILATGEKPRSVAAGDLDGDQRPDLAAGCDDGRIYLYTQREGRFALLRSLRSTPATWGLGLGDFDGDGSLDIAAASYLDRSLFIHLNLGDGSFQREQALQSGDHNFDLVVRDFDLDGDLDVVTCSTVDAAVNFHLNDGSGRLGPRIKVQSGQWNAGIGAADFDGDGDPDLAVASIDDNSVVIHRNIIVESRPKPPPPEFCVRGQVLDGRTRQPVPQATVSLLQPNGSSLDNAITDAEGRFRFCPQPLRPYLIAVRALGYPHLRVPFRMPAADTAVELLLEAPHLAEVVIWVHDAGTLRPLAGAKGMIRADSGTVTAFTADSKGEYRARLPLGRAYTAQAAFSGYQPGTAAFQPAPDHQETPLRVPIPLAQAQAVLPPCIAGKVYDEKTGLPVAGARVQLLDTADRELGRLQTRQDGRYRFCAEQPGLIRLSAGAKGYFFLTQQYELVPGESVLDLPLKPLEKDAHIVLNNLYFDVDKSTLRPESVAELNRMLDILREHPGLVVEISGHTDSDASDSYNQRLSENRARAVTDYLAEAGIAPARMVARGYGEAQPIVPNDSPANKQLNRRTEFKVVELGEGALRGE